MTDKRNVFPFPRLQSSGGPPHNDGMDARVSKLEDAIAGLPKKADFADLRADVKTGISDLRTEIHKNSIDLHRWMIGTVIGVFLGFGGLFLAMSNALKQPATTAAPSLPQTQQPIIINVPPAAPAPAPAPAPAMPASQAQ